MSSHFCIPPFLRGSMVRERLLELYALYEELDASTRAWQTSSGITCPAGCGRCCEPYEPEVLALEGMAVAAYLMQVGREGELQAALPTTRERPGCLLYDASRPEHCSVYPARPLECRLFAVSGLQDKRGVLSYRPCKHMPPLSAAPMGAALLPAMGQYSGRLRGLAPAEVPAGLREQTRAAIAALLLLKSYRTADGPSSSGDKAPPERPPTAPATRPRRGAA